MPISKPFRCAVEGATCDGRILERQHLTEMAAQYNQNVYGARVNLEHYRGFAVNGDYKMYGDVISLSTEEIADGPLKGKLALMAVVDATDDLVKLKKERQKVYHSIEVHPCFADTGKAYLMGLACTDSPASLGGEFMRFCAGAAVNPLASRKSSPECFFTEAIESLIEFEEIAPAPEAGKSFLSRITDLLKGTERKFNSETGDTRAAIEAVAQSQAELLDKFATVAAGRSDFALAADLTALAEQFSQLKSKLESEDANHYSRRPLATGNDGRSTENQADC